MAFEETHKMFIDRNGNTGINAVLLTVLIAVIGWVGTSLITRVDELSATFNAYALKMESRVTVLEQRVRKD